MVIANFVWRPPQIWLIAFIVAAVGTSALCRRAPSLAFPLVILSLIPLGAFYLQVTDAAQVTPPVLSAFATGEGTVDITAHVMREGIVRDSPFGGKQESVDVETEQLATGDHELSAPIGLRLTIFSKRSEEDEARDSGAEPPLPVYTYGERLRFPRSCERRETTATPAHSIWWDIWHRRGFG
jgi:hypothetical protein